MITVQVDGTAMLTEIGDMKTLGDLVELIKATIDPDAIITSLSFGGDVLNDRDWVSPLVTHTGRTLEVTTGSKRTFLADRLKTAEFFIDQIISEFLEASSLYQNGNFEKGNSSFATAVEDLLAFVNWYNSLLLVDEQGMQSQLAEFENHVNVIKKTCEQLLQQQLYQSWWVLAETVKTRLKPLLDDLRAYCLENAAAAQSGV